MYIISNKMVHYLFVYILIDLGWEMPDLKKFIKKQFGPSFCEDHKNLIRTIGVTREGFALDKDHLCDIIYSRTLTKEPNAPRFIVWRVSY